jgi:8-oxo-dGTP diphosphatase
MPHIHELYDFTASAFVIHPTEKKICLLNHKKLGKWLQPGGHVELNEDPIQALEHELLEETGLVLADCEIIEPAQQPQVRGQKTLPLPQHINVHNLNETHKHIDMQYLIRSSTDVLSPADGESQEIDWLDIEQIRQLHADGKMFDGTLDLCEWIFENNM